MLEARLSTGKAMKFDMDLTRFWKEMMYGSFMTSVTGWRVSPAHIVMVREVKK